MKIFNLEIRRSSPERKSFGLGLGESLGWTTLGTNVTEAETGAWQRNLIGHRETVLGYSAVYACVSLIASDIAKTRLCLVEEDDDGIWEETSSAAFSPVLRKPNHYQNRIKFIEQWLVSKLTHGNTYVLKVRDGRGVVRSLYVLDPTRVLPLIAPDGSVFYRLSPDYHGANTLSGEVEETIVVPAREIIHDIMVALQHPLVGVSPIFACALAAIQGLQIQEQSAHFFKNGSNPGGIIMVPGAIKQAQADEVKNTWETKFKGKNAGKVAILSDGMKYQPMAVNAHDAQLIEQLKWSAETVCSCFHVPPYMIGVGQAPTYNNIEALNAQYYAQCLQTLIESLELCLDEGLELPDPYGTQFDLDDLLRMDTSTLIKAEKEAAGIKTINESRARLGLKPTAGGESVYLQEQNWPVRLLSERELPAKTPTAPAPIIPPTEPAADPTGGGTKALDLAADDLAAVVDGFAEELVA